MIEKLSLGLGKPLPPRLPGAEEYTVDFDGEDDPLHPYNWPQSIKYDCMTRCDSRPGD